MQSPTSGLRHRIIEPSAPAPVPTPRPQATSRRISSTEIAEPQPTASQDDDNVVRSTGSMAIATLVSRITGFLRNVLITTVLGGAIASAFNTANTLPNLITEIVLGAVLTSLVVPVLVRAEKEDPDKGEAFIRRLFTLAATLLGGVTLAAVVGAPFLITLPLGPDSKVNVVQATSFAYLLLPQIFFYGIFALLMAVLNTKNVFKPGAWAPVVNNVITLAVLCAYLFVPGQLDPDHPASITDPHVLLLGVGTTAGVIAQALVLMPAIRRLGISLRPLWGLDARLKQFGGMALAIVVYVAISQAGYFITTRIAAEADAEAPNIYQQAWLLLQVPYGIIGVTLLTAIMPRLSRNAANADDRAVVRDLVLGSKLTFLALIPIVIFFNAFGTQIANGLFAYGRFGPESATLLGWTLTFSSFTLLPYALVLLHLRVFYAREEAWTPTYIIAGITLTKVLLSMLAPLVAASPAEVVVLLGAANGFGFVAGAIIGGLLLRRKLGNLGSMEVLRTSAWAAGASIIGVLVALLVARFLRRLAAPMFGALGSPGFLLEVAVAGVVFLVVTGLVLSRSGLPEVLNLGAVLRRVPGMHRIIKPAPAEDAKPSALTVLAAESVPFDDTFNATPVPPPMSAGIVRGPRLVPGAEVSDGRFRLLADHGSAGAARFWHAREKATGREVALVFVDTSGTSPQAPRTAAGAAGAAAEVVRRTQKLATLNHAAIAPNISVQSYRNGCLVVADWIPGAPLSSVDADDVEPQAAVYAFEPLADAMMQAHEQHTPLGVDNRARLRVSTDGIAVLAFPAVLDTTSVEKDYASLRTALGSLVHADAPTRILSMFNREPEELPAAILALHTEDAQLEVTEDATPQPSATPGFGRATYSKAGIALLAASAVALVVIIGVITAYITALFEPQRGPVQPQPVPSVLRSEERPLPGIVIEPASTEVMDDGMSQLLSFDEPAVLSHVVVDVVHAKGMTIEVYALDSAQRSVSAVSGQLLGSGEVDERVSKISVKAKDVHHIAVVLKGTPDSGNPEVYRILAVLKD